MIQKIKNYINVQKEASESISEEDHLKWKQGADNFREYYNNVDQNKHYTNQEDAEVELLFLGEKPASFMNTLAMDSKESLKTYGFENIGGFIFNRNKVISVMQEHPEIFHNFSDVNQLMQKLSTADMRTEMHLERGLILGYPIDSVQGFLSQEHFMNTLRPQIIQAIRNKNGKENSRDEKKLLNAIISKDSTKTGAIMNKYHDNIAVTTENSNAFNAFFNRRTGGVKGLRWMNYTGGTLKTGVLESRLKMAFKESNIQKIPNEKAIFPIIHSLRRKIQAINHRRS
jgi:hypothetical protein